MTERVGHVTECTEKGGGDTGEVDEDEKDRREMDEIRRRIKERKLSKKKKTVQIGVTEATKPAKSATVSTPTKELRKDGRKEKDKMCKIDEKISAGRRVSKKPAAPRATLSSADAAQREKAISWASSAVSETSVVKLGGGDKEVTRPMERYENSDRYTDIAGEMAIQDFIASQYPPVEETVSSTVRMGRALVSGALGMRTDDPKYFETAVKLPECTVVIQSTRRKAKAPVSGPPPNSIESERDLNESGDLHLSQSATDMGVVVELPGAIIEAISVGGREPKTGESLNTAGAADMSTTDAAVSVLGGLPHQESQQCAAGSQQCAAESQQGVAESQQSVADSQQCVQESHRGVKESPTDAARSRDNPDEGEVTVSGVNEICVAERCRIMTEIEKSKLLREELIRQDPSLATVASSMSTVCGGSTVETTGKDRVDGEIRAADPKCATTPGQIQPRTDAKYVERQRLTRITAAKSLLEEELQKTRPSLSSIAAFRAAAYGEDKVPELATIENDLATVIETIVLTSVMSLPLAETHIGETPGSGKPAKVRMVVVEAEGASATGVLIEDEVATEIVVSDDAAMSVGDSDEEEESDGFSRSGSGSSREESILSRGSRKRPADESPEREVAVTIRKEFPGLVSRSEAGCRIHVPVVERVGAMEVMTQLMTTTTAAKEVSVLRTAYATDAIEPTKEMCGAEPLRAAGTKEGIALVAAPVQVVDLGATATLMSIEPMAMISEEGVAAPADPMWGTSEYGLVGRCQVVSEETTVMVSDLEKLGVPTPSASGICSTTTAELGVSELGGDHRATAALRPPLLAAEGWARDAQMIEGIFRIMEGMEPPWVTLDVLEAATVRFPTIDREILQRTIMTVMMTQRRCVVRLTRAGLRRGARTDRDGNSFVELDLDFADRYSMSH